MAIVPFHKVLSHTETLSDMLELLLLQQRNRFRPLESDEDGELMPFKANDGLIVV